MTFGVDYRMDKRDVRIYPLNGSYWDLGIGFRSFIESSRNYISIGGSARKYGSFFPRLSYGIAGSYRHVFTDNLPFPLIQSFGFGDFFVRGYELYVVPGQVQALGKSSLKYHVIPRKTMTLKPLKGTKFYQMPHALYLNFNLDAGYSYQNTPDLKNNLVNKYMMGGGFGLDYVIYYHLVLRVEYSMNRMGEKGLFYHFSAAF